MICDPNNALINIHRKRLSNIIRRSGGEKTTTSIEDLGCTAEEYRMYIEGLFLEGMNFENHGTGPGKWNVHHRRPCATFNVLDEDERKMCFHFTNHEPMWSNENLRLGSTFIEEEHPWYWNGERWEPIHTH